MTAFETQTRFSDYVARSLAPATPAFVGASACAAIFFGWLQSEREYLTPKSGAGYWLGIAGVSAMLLLLFYSYRKRRRRTVMPGSIPTWFRIHMFLGVFGPVLILYHSNFRLGALNSNFALLTMLIVMASGGIGRYVYGKIHIGLHGRKALAQEIFLDVKAMRRELGHDLDRMDELLAEVSDFGQHIFEKQPPGALGSLWRGALLVAQSHFLRRSIDVRVHKEMQDKAIREGWPCNTRRIRVAESEAKICAYFNAILKAVELRFYERLFALWHVLHLPLFFVMVVAATVHVWAVHRF